MKTSTLVLSLALAMASAVPAYASNAKPPGKGEICHERSHNNACANSHKGGHVHAVPEINTASAGLVLALLGGLLAIRRERSARRQA